MNASDRALILQAQDGSIDAFSELVERNWVWLVRQPNVAAPERSDRKVQEEIPLGQGQILLWLDSQTPLYMTY